MILGKDNCARILEMTGELYLAEGLNLSGQGRLTAPCLLYPGSGSLDSVSLGGYSYLVPPYEAAYLQIGNYCSIAAGLTVGLGHPVNLLTASPVAWRPWLPGCNFPGQTSHQYASTIIGSDVWIGARVIIKAGVRIGDGCFIGAGSVVTRDIPPWSVAAGNPCRVIRCRFPEELQRRIERLRWFDYDWRDQQVNWRDPVASLDDMERALDSGFGRRFVHYGYEIAADDSKMDLYREEALS